MSLFTALSPNHVLFMFVLFASTSIAVIYSYFFASVIFNPLHIVIQIPNETEGTIVNSFSPPPREDSEPPSPQRAWMKNGRVTDGESEGEVIEDDEGVHEEGYGDLSALGNSTLDAELWKLIRVAAEGRQIHHIQVGCRCLVLASVGLLGLVW